MLSQALYLLALTAPQVTALPPTACYTPSQPLRSTGENGYIGGLYMCTNYAYQGTCSYARYTPSVCYNLAPPYLNNVSSFLPDQYAGADMFKFQCAIWNETACAGTKVVKQWPGTNNLWFEGGNVLDNKGKSVRCDFLDSEGLETWRAWKEQGYDFDSFVEREGECGFACEQMA
ncbi:hypothetical protein BDW02DRAFT_101794 [Decorospora gaudefroyi]|uniref:Uncharacterized protein n=1 Tax=Decorospora gaudefroyi TaxID=184978 RepID=A0A6A5K0H0_9PLEO|nr:hypothetical protein BDW02DRAFT_101794 [Decorospora gaudefroyi]